jgi:hypothetical protein
MIKSFPPPDFVIEAASKAINDRNDHQYRYRLRLGVLIA